MLHIRLLGGFQLTLDNMSLAIHSTRVQSLLAYLVLHPDLPHARQQLAFLFWPVSSERQAYTNLRKLIYQLRQAWPQIQDFLQDDQHTLQWRRMAPYTLDVDELNELLTQSKRPGFDLARLTHIVDSYTGELLPSCYDDWILPLRQQYHQGIRQALEQLILALENQRAYEEGLRYAQRLLDLDPLEEATYRHLMRLRALKGDRTGVLRVYRQCIQVLQEELGVEPSPETQQTYAQVIDLPPTTPSAAIASGGGTVETIALVGRMQEWARLQAAWQQTLQGHAQFVIISGEAGIGKTRLAEELLSWAGYHGAVTARTRAYAAQGALAYAPVAELLRSPTLQTRYKKLAAVWRGEMARLLPELLETDPQLPAPEPMRESWQRQRFWEALARALRGNEQQSLCLLIDDLQWCDQETLTWLAYLLQSNSQVRLLVVGTLRDDELTLNHPFHMLQLELQRNDQLQAIALTPLSSEESTTLACQVASETIAEMQAAQLFRETAGNPLFVVETVRARAGRMGGMASEGVGEARAGATPEQPMLPPKIYATICHRLRQLSPSAQELVTLAATLGRAFTFELLATASQQDEAVVAHALDELWQRRIVREQAEGYDFSHDRIRDVAYQEIGKNQQRLLHRRIATTLETLHAGATEEVSGLLAVHYNQAGLPPQAIAYYRSAAQRSISHYAFHDAVRLLYAALALVPALPTPARAAEELTLQTELVDILGYSTGRTDELEQGLQVH